MIGLIGKAFVFANEYCKYWRGMGNPNESTLSFSMHFTQVMEFYDLSYGLYKIGNQTLIIHCLLFYGLALFISSLTN